VTIYTAKIIFTAAGPPLPHGTVTVDGERIVAVEPHGVGAPDVDLGDVAIIPGLVNAHTHLDLSGARGLIPPTDPEHFTDWLMGVIEYRKGRTTEETQFDIAAGLEECLSTGATLIGDIAVDGGSWSCVANTKSRANIYYEFIGMSDESSNRSYFKLLHWLNDCNESKTIRAMVSPHAVYSVRGSLIRSLARSNQGIAIHLAESPAELQFVEHQSGPFIKFLKNVGIVDPEGIAESIEWVLWRTRQSPSALLVHCNYLSGDTEIWPNQSIVYCPRTHAAFKHPRHPFAEFQARGVNVALGTDSLASNPDLDLFEEARFVYHNRKDVSSETILKMATINGAKALGFDADCGSLEPGKSADFVVMPLGKDCRDPYEMLFNAPPCGRRTLFRGEWRDRA